MSHFKEPEEEKVFTMIAILFGVAIVMSYLICRAMA
jgi:uncharacterized membrane protein YciS (DUF1049 family)